jgi:phosphatidylserine/phosphatidylglycerophosphate/cardiolipin synthase-like enzyme
MTAGKRGTVKSVTFRRRLGLLLRRLPFLLLPLIGVGLYQSSFKDLPPGIDYGGEVHRVPVGEVAFLRDLTFRGEGGEITHEQEIFDAILARIEDAEKYILLDMFLFNDYTTEAARPLRGIAEELTSRLLEKKRLSPSIRIDVITDPINTVYGGHRSAQVKALEAAGINVVITDLRRLRDSNPGYSSLWRVFLQWFGNSDGGGLFPHPFSDSSAGVTLRSYLDMLNFKANHRKVFTADRGDGMVTIVTSANPHDGSSAHSNVALEIGDGLWRDVFETEGAVALLSGSRLGPVPPGAPPRGAARDGESAGVALLTEGRIKGRVLSMLRRGTEGDRLWMAMFYLSDRDVVDALVDASNRGVKVRLVLDPNRDAFGYSKNGIPNRQVARELVERTGGSLQVRWYDTHGEQFHSKMVFLERAGKEAEVILGSANLTRRNLDSFNLELDVWVTADGRSALMGDVRSYLEKIWENRDGLFTVEYEVFADDSRLRRVIYRLQEFTGLCSF